MALKGTLATLATMLGWENPASGGVGLKDVIQQLRGLKVVATEGAAAGNITITGIATEDHLVSVQHLAGDGTQLNGGAADLTAEFSITAANTINNTGGTSTANGVVIVTYFDQSAGA